MDGISLLERDYRDVDPKLISSAYEHLGFKLVEGYEQTMWVWSLGFYPFFA